MRPSEYELMFRMEERLWWFRGMQAISRAVLNRWYAPNGRLRILDAGCGTGGAWLFLRHYGAVTSVDVSPLALRLAARRAPAARACASVAALPLPAGAFDLVTSLDVLVMLEPEEADAALREMSRVLAPGGRLLVRVAAYDWLRGAHDRAWRVRRRYTSAQLRRDLERVGLQVDLLGHANFWLLPLAVIKRLAERLFPSTDRSDLAISFGPADPVFGSVLASEAPLVARGWLPAGLSLVAVARKPALL